MFRRILVAIDNGRTGRRGLLLAIRLAREQGAQLCIVHVIELPVQARYAGHGSVGEELVRRLRESGRKTIAGAAALAARSGLDAQCRLTEAAGRNVAELVLRQASALRAGLIVMGTHGERGASRLVLGSVAENVLRQSHVPVLLVRGYKRTAAETLRAASRAMRMLNELEAHWGRE